MNDSQLVLYDEDYRKILAVIQRLVKDANAKGCFVVDRNGQVRGRFRLTEPDQVEMLKRLLAVVEAEQPQEGERRSEPTGDTPAQDAPDGKATASVP